MTKEVMQQALDAMLALHKIAADTEGAHRWHGDCPDESQPTARDPGCHGCRIMVKADALIAALRTALDAPQQAVAVPGAVWEDDGVSLIRRGTEDARCKSRGAERLYRIATPQAAPATALEAKQSVAPSVVAGALYDLMGYLTTLDQSISLGATELATPAADALVAWAKKRGLSLDSADIEHWQEHIGSMPLPAAPKD